MAFPFIAHCSEGGWAQERSRPPACPWGCSYAGLNKIRYIRGALAYRRQMLDFLFTIHFHFRLWVLFCALGMGSYAQIFFPKRSVWSKLFDYLWGEGHRIGRNFGKRLRKLMPKNCRISCRFQFFSTINNSFVSDRVLFSSDSDVWLRLRGKAADTEALCWAVNSRSGAAWGGREGTKMVPQPMGLFLHYWLPFESPGFQSHLEWWDLGK